MIESSEISNNDLDARRHRPSTKVILKALLTKVIILKIRMYSSYMTICPNTC